jgi:hypothetical protein
LTDKLIIGLISKKLCRVLGSKYYIQYAKEQFLLRWSTLSRLSEYGRKTTVQLIQPYYELDQFLVFVEQNLPLLKSLENRYLTNNKSDTTTRDLFLERVHKDLLSQWQLPDVIRSSIQTWDDIVTNRALFLDVSKRSNTRKTSFSFSLKF